MPMNRAAQTQAKRSKKRSTNKPNPNYKLLGNAQTNQNVFVPVGISSPRIATTTSCTAGCTRTDFHAWCSARQGNSISVGEDVDGKVSRLMLTSFLRTACSASCGTAFFSLGDSTVEKSNGFSGSRDKASKVWKAAIVNWAGVKLPS